MTPRWKSTAALLIVMATIGAVSAQGSAETGAQKVDCQKAISTPELNYCEELELEKADQSLNIAYRATLARIDAATHIEPKVRKEWRQSVVDAQRKWIAFRDSDCNGAMGYEWYGGTGAALAALGCLREKTLARTKELRERNAK